MTQICAAKIAMLCHYDHFFACFVPPAKIRLCLQTAKRFLDCFRGLLEVLGYENGWNRAVFLKKISGEFWISVNLFGVLRSSGQNGDSCLFLLW